MAELTYRDAVVAALAQEMERDQRVLLIGQDLRMVLRRVRSDPTATGGGGGGGGGGATGRHRWSRTLIERHDVITDTGHRSGDAGRADLGFRVAKSHSTFNVPEGAAWRRPVQEVAKAVDEPR